MSNVHADWTYEQVLVLSTLAVVLTKLSMEIMLNKPADKDVK